MRLSDYENQLSLPRKEDFTTTYYYKAGEVVATVRPGDKPYALPAGAVKDTVVNEEAFKVARAEYGRHDARLHEMFIVDLMQDNGVPDDEFTRTLFSIAYSNGHSSGLFEVESQFQQLAHLVSLAKKVYGK